MFWLLVGYWRDPDCTCPSLAIVVARGNNPVHRHVLRLALDTHDASLGLCFAAPNGVLDPSPQLVFYSQADLGGLSRSCGSEQVFLVHEAEARATFHCRCGRSVRLSFRRFDGCPSAVIAPPFATLASQPSQSALSVTLSAQSTGLSSSGALRRRESAFLILPGNYSGDSWACAAAMLLDPDIELVLASKTELGEDESPEQAPTNFDGIAQQFLNFVKGVRGIERLDQRLILKSGGLGQHGNASAVAKEVAQAISGRIGVQADPVCGWTFASTSVIMRYAEQHGIAALHRALIAGFCEQHAPFDQLVKAIADLGPCVLLNMRVGHRGNHPQHNMTETIYGQLRKQITACGLKIVRVGTYQSGTETPEAQWMTGLRPDRGDGELVNFFEKGKFTDRRHVAYFWSQVATLRNVVGIIGGRSGSLDIAALMGVRTLCWDIIEADDGGYHEFLRQLLMYPLMSLCPRVVPKKKGGGLYYFDPQKPSPAGGIDPGFVDLWLSGHHVIPSVSILPQLLTTCGHLSDDLLKIRDRLLLRPLRYIQPLLANIDEERGILADHARGRRYRIGRVEGGGECLFRAIATLKLKDLPTAPAALRQEVAKRIRASSRMNAGDIADRIATAEAPVDTMDLPAVAEALGITIRLYEAHYGALRYHAFTEHNAGRGTTLGLLLRNVSSEREAHYDPLEPI